MVWARAGFPNLTDYTEPQSLNNIHSRFNNVSIGQQYPPLCTSLVNDRYAPEFLASLSLMPLSNLQRSRSTQSSLQYHQSLPGKLREMFTAQQGIRFHFQFFPSATELFNKFRSLLSTSQFSGSDPFSLALVTTLDGSVHYVATLNALLLSSTPAFLATMKEIGLRCLMCRTADDVLRHA